MKWKVILVLNIMLFLDIPSWGQVGKDRLITGFITDKENAEPLIGVNITLKGSDIGVISNEKGNYEIKAKIGDIIVFSYVGYQTTEVTVGNNLVIDLGMTSEAALLDDIVIVAYGQVKKSDLTGSVSSISGEAISRSAPISVDQALQGRAAGVQVTQVSGRPGGETSIRIRGTSSINAGNEPLFVIDGMLITNDNNQLNGGAVAGSPLNGLASINPADIESIEILKDASATAMYGARGSNGVVIISTKRGKAGTSRISFDSYQGMQTVTKKLPVLTGQEFAQYMNAFNADAKLPVDVRYFIPERIGQGTDWQEAIFRQARMQSYQLNLSGGNNKTRFAVSGGYVSQDGIIINSDFKNYTFRINVDHEVNSWIKTGASLSSSNIQSKGVLTGAQSSGTGVLLPGSVTTALLFPSSLPVLDSTRAGGYTYQDDRGRNLANPVADALETDNISTNVRTIGNFNTTFTVAKGLSFKVNLGADVFSVSENRYVPNYLKRGESTNGAAVLARINGRSWLAEYTMNYDKVIGDNQFNFLIGNTYQGFFSERIFLFTFDFQDNRTGYHAISAGLNPQPPGNGESSWGMISYLSRFNWTHKDKVLFTLTGRVDGSSKFGVNNKYGFFPSAALAYKLHKEDFISDLNIFSTFKVRLSYGIIGNQEIASFSSLATIGNLGEGVFDGTEFYKGKEPLRYPNPDLKWERTHQADLGIDMEFNEGKVSLVFDVYQKRTRDLLLYAPLPTTSGFGYYLTNIGGLKNTGVELALTTTNLDTKLFWSTTFNISHNRNIITALASEREIPIGGILNVPTGWSILKKGEAIGTFYGYKSAGLFQSAEELKSAAKIKGQTPALGDRRYVDINGRDSKGVLTLGPDGFIDEADRVPIGRATPDLTFGIINNFRFKGFDFSFFLQGMWGNDLINANLLEIGSLNGEANVLRDYWENRWTPQNTNTIYPKVNPSERNIFSDAQVESGSFIRIKNISLGYTIPASLLKKIRINQLRIYASANNIYNFTKYSGFDPELFAFGQSSLLQGVDYGGYPMSRTIFAGIQISF
jgi:TonB-linked SusC/RagA family outer membrane protein